MHLVFDSKAYCYICYIMQTKYISYNYTEDYLPAVFIILVSQVRYSKLMEYLSVQKRETEIDNLYFDVIVLRNENPR